jgi:hypothetical protein
MTAGPDHAVVAQGDLSHLRDLKRFLEARGIDARMMQPPQGCGSG